MTASVRDALRSATPFVQPQRFLVPILVGVSVLGCGGTENAEPTAATQPAVDAAPVAQATVPEPTEIVSQFLDRVRRGGEGNSANDLLTRLANQEMVRVGRPLEFPGSPDTQFEVRQAFPVPNQDNQVWVQTVLSEPDETGGTFQYEVVWTLKRESEGWRISGYAIDPGEGAEPLDIDFEDGDRLAALLDGSLTR